ncbi:hypothetical protein ACHAWT_003338 [Skeletonema menzelii]
MTIMLLRNLAIATALCATSIQGFAPSAPSMRIQTARNLMTAEEVKSIIDEAESCSRGECALDEVEDLISSLLAQQSLLSKRIAEIDGLVKDLEHVNGRDERPTDEIRETVRAIFRIFALGDKASGNDYPSLSKPTGYSGEVAGGGKTAYDVLPPKPFKK